MSRPIHDAKKLGRGFNPVNGEAINETPKGGNTSYDVQIDKIGPSVRPVRVTNRRRNQEERKKERQRKKPDSGKLADTAHVLGSKSNLAW